MWNLWRQVVVLTANRWRILAPLVFSTPTGIFYEKGMASNQG